MGLLRKMQRRQQLADAIGVNVAWREDLRSLLHLVRALGFSDAETRAEVWGDKSPGRFIPGVRILAQGKEHAFSLAPVPGTLEGARRAWSEFLGRGIFNTEMFQASSVATPEFAEGLVVALEKEGFTIPAKERAAGKHLSPVSP